MPYIVDSCIFINYLRGKPKSKEFLDKVVAENIVAYISRITEIEVFWGQKRSDSERQKRTLAAFSLFSTEEITDLIALETGYLLNEFARYMGNSTDIDKLPIADAIIAATARLKKYTVLSSNTKHFKQLEAQGIINLEEYKED